MRILRLALKVGSTSAPYNQFTLPLLESHDVTLCTYFGADVPVDHRVNYVDGDGLLIGFLRRLKALLSTNEFDVVHVHSPHLALLFMAVTLVVKPRLLQRSVLHVHSSYPVFRMRNRWMLLPAFLMFGRVVCCGHAARRSFPRLYRWLAGWRLTTICNGVDLRRVDREWQPRGVGTIDRTEDLQLVSVGNLRALKNHEVVLQALAQARATDVQLTIISDGPARTRLEALCDELGIADRVQFAGQMTRNQTLRHLWRADAFVSMSRGEGLPVAVLEAMSCHCPVVLSNIPAHREIRGQRADLIPLLLADDCQGLARAIDAWASMPLDVLRAWGADCRQHIEGSYSLDQMLDQFETMLEEFDPRMTLEWGVFCRSVHAEKRPPHVA